MRSSQRIRQTLQKYQRKPVTQQGILGNEVGEISVPNRVDYVYVRVAGLGTISIYNKRVPLILDLPVDVGYDPLEPKNFQVLNIHRYPQGGGRGLVDVSTILHGKTHNWGGIDPVFIEKRQLMPLRPTPLGGMQIYVTREVTYYDDKAVQVTGQQLDLAPYVPATGSWLVLVYKDTDEIIKISTGGALKDIFTLSMADAPQAYPGTVPIALIRLYGGQSGIAEGYQDTDLIDVRQLFSPIDLTGTAGSGGHVIQDEGVSRTQRTNLNFKGALVWALDNAGTDSTDIIISGSSVTTGTANIEHLTINVTNPPTETELESTGTPSNKLNTITILDDNGSGDKEYLVLSDGDKFWHIPLVKASETVGVLASATNATTAQTTPTYDTSGEAVHPSVVHIPAGWNGYNYWMANTPFPGGDTSLENPCILASDDGNAWEVPAGLTNPIAAFPGGDEHYDDPELLISADGTTLYCYYCWTKYNTHACKIYVRSSTDGITWSAATELLSDTNSYQALASPCVIYDGSQYVMWYVDASSTPSVLKRRTCATPAGTWSAAGTCTLNNTPAGLYLWHIGIQKRVNKYHGVAVFASSLAPPTSAGPMYFLTSSDGLTWTFDSTALLNPGSSGRWDDGFLYRASLVQTATGYDMWYSASDDPSSWVHPHIGRTPVTIITASELQRIVTLYGDKDNLEGLVGTLREISIVQPSGTNEFGIFDGNIITWYGAGSGVVTGSHTIMDEGATLPHQPVLNFIGTSVWAVNNAGQGRTDIIISGTSSGGGHTIEDEGTPLTQRSKLNFVGAPVVVTDDVGNDRTIVTISNITGSASGHTIRDESTPLTQRANLSFKGSTIWAVDNAGDDSTDIIISGSASGGGTSSRLLDYAASTDLFNGAAISATTWTDVIADQNFTVTNANAVIAISVFGSVRMGHTTTASYGSTRLVIDSAGTPIYKSVGFCQWPAATYYNALGGTNTYFITGLSAGQHTVKLQMYSGIAAVVYLRALTVPIQEFLSLQVVQLA